uniref:Uncharacterized protein n=1 Tax=Elaeophora elaphi TaxID=1147741 RepID=A0A0R3RFG1_9BILA
MIISYVSFNGDLLQRTEQEKSQDNIEDVQTGMVKGTGSYTVSILLHGTNSESMAPGDIVSSYREIHIELQTKFQPMKLCLNGITTSEEVCVQRVVVNGSEVYHR